MQDAQLDKIPNEIILSALKRILQIQPYNLKLFIVRNSLAEGDLICSIRTFNTGFQLAIFEIQTNRGCLKGAKYFVCPITNRPDQFLTLNWT